MPDEKKVAPKSASPKSESKSEEPKSKATPDGEKRRVAVYGTEREAYEHIYGKLEVDPRDPRFVLVDAETEKKIRDLPSHAVPPTVGNSKQDRDAVYDAMDDAADIADKKDK